MNEINVRITGVDLSNIALLGGELTITVPARLPGAAQVMSTSDIVSAVRGSGIPIEAVSGPKVLNKSEVSSFIKKQPLVVADAETVRDAVQSDLDTLIVFGTIEEFNKFVRQEGLVGDRIKLHDEFGNVVAVHSIIS